jgi:hypothetical protein
MLRQASQAGRKLTSGSAKTVDLDKKQTSVKETELLQVKADCNEIKERFLGVLNKEGTSEFVDALATSLHLRLLDGLIILLSAPLHSDDMKHVFDVILRQAQSHPSDAAALAQFASCALLLRGDIDSTFKNTNHLNSSGHDAIIKTESSHFHLPFFSHGDSHSSSDHSVPVTEIHNENRKSFKMFASRSASSTHHENESSAQELKRSQKELSLLLTAIASNYETPSTRAKLTPLALVFSQPSICSPAKELRWLLLGVKPRLETSRLSQHGGALQAVDANVFGSCEEAIRVYKLRIYNLSLNHVHATHKLRPLLQISLGSHVFKSDVAVSNPAADQYNWGNYAVEVNVDSITLNSTLLACELKYKGAVFGSTTVGSVSVPLSGLLVSDIQQESFPLVQKGQNETDDGREMEKSNNTPPSLTLSVELLDRN